MEATRTWYKIASMDKQKLKDAMITCLSMGLKSHTSDDGINPPAVWLLASPVEYRRVVRAAGYSI